MLRITFESVYDAWPWRPIPGCPGRFVLSPAVFHGPPSGLCDGLENAEIVPGAADPAVVIRFPGGGLLSYRKPDGSFVHTLNTAEGLARKLAEMGGETFSSR